MQTTVQKFEFQTIIDSLMSEMEMDKATPEMQKNVADDLARQLAYRIMTELSLALTEDQTQTLLTSEKETLAEAIENAIVSSEDAAYAVQTVIDEFYNETLEAYKTFKA